MLPVRLLVNSRLFLVKFWGSQKLYTDFHFDYLQVGTPNLHIVQGSTVPLT